MINHEYLYLSINVTVRHEEGLVSVNDINDINDIYSINAIEVTNFETEFNGFIKAIIESYSQKGFLKSITEFENWAHSNDVHGLDWDAARILSQKELESYTMRNTIRSGNFELS
jgi:hypothetical protein